MKYSKYCVNHTNSLHMEESKHNNTGSVMLKKQIKKSKML